MKLKGKFCYLVFPVLTVILLVLVNLDLRNLIWGMIFWKVGLILTLILAVTPTTDPRKVKTEQNHPDILPFRPHLPPGVQLERKPLTSKTRNRKNEPLKLWK